MIIKHPFNLPDGAGGSNTHHFDTSADRVLYLDSMLDIFLASLDSRLTGQVSSVENPKDKQIWFDANERKIKFYNAETGLWESFEVSSFYEPTNPVDKQIWFDVSERTVKIYNAETGLWENFEIPNSDEPTNPVNNQTWFDVSDNTIKKYNATTGEWEIFIAKPVKTGITIPKSGWVLDNSETSDYKYYYEIAVADLKAEERGSIETVLEAGVCPSDNEAMTGKFRIYAAAVPANPINATYVVWRG